MQHSQAGEPEEDLFADMPEEMFWQPPIAVYRNIIHANLSAQTRFVFILISSGVPRNTIEALRLSGLSKDEFIESYEQLLETNLISYSDAGTSINDPLFWKCEKIKLES